MVTNLLLNKSHSGREDLIEFENNGVYQSRSLSMHIRSISVIREEDFDRSKKKKKRGIMYLLKIGHLIDLSKTKLKLNRANFFLFKKKSIVIRNHPLNFNWNQGQ